MDPTLVSLARGLPHAALDGLFEALAKIQTERQQRGRALAEPENVSGVGADARGVRANVSDDHHYVTRWAWSEEGAQSLCSCAAARACEHAFALGLLLLVAARRAGRWDHARWSKLASPALAAEPAGRESGDPPQGPGARLDASRHEHAVEALAQWADRGQAAPRRLRAVLDLEPGTLGALLTLEVRVTGAGLDDAPRTRRQLEQLSGELKRQPLLLAPPEARLLRALTSPEFVGPDASGRGSLPGGTRIELSSERMQALLDRVPESPHFTWSPGLPQALAERAGVSPGARASLHTEEVRVVPVCDSSVEPPRLELSLEWPDGSTRPLSEAGLAAGPRLRRPHARGARGRTLRPHRGRAATRRGQAAPGGRARAPAERRRRAGEALALVPRGALRAPAAHARARRGRDRMLRAGGRRLAARARVRGGARFGLGPGGARARGRGVRVPARARLDAARRRRPRERRHGVGG